MPDYNPAAYRDCEQCGLCKTRFQVVQYRLKPEQESLTGPKPGMVLLWVGEAPGPTENIEGIPFVGPAGHLLNDLLADMDVYFPGKLLHAITNVVCCIPYANVQTREFRPPTEKEVNACAPRLAAFIAACKPDGIVLLGKVARAHILRLMEEERIRVECPLIAVTHPSYMLRGQNHAGVQAYFEAVAIVKTFLDVTLRGGYAFPAAQVVLD